MSKRREKEGGWIHEVFAKGPEWYAPRAEGVPRTTALSFLKDYARPIDRLVFFNMGPAERARWLGMQGGHPRRFPGLPALMVAGLR